MVYSINLPVDIYTNNAIELAINAYSDYVIVNETKCDNIIILNLTVKMDYSDNRVDLIHGFMNHLLTQSAIDILSGDK